jgi:hypothetical protein
MKIDSIRKEKCYKSSENSKTRSHRIPGTRAGGTLRKKKG